MTDNATSGLVHHQGRKSVRTLQIRHYMNPHGTTRHLDASEVADLLDYVRQLEDAAFGITVLGQLHGPAEAQGAPSGLRVRDPEGRRWIKTHADYEHWERTDEGPLIITRYSSGAMSYPLETYHETA